MNNAKKDERTAISRDSLLETYLKQEKLAFFHFVPSILLGFAALILTMILVTCLEGFVLATVIGLCLVWVGWLILSGVLLYPALRTRFLLKQGRFTLEEDEYRYTREEYVSGCRTPRRFLYFQKYGRAGGTSSLYTLLREGDRVYVAVLHGRKPRILGVFHPAMYRRTDEEST